MIHAIFYPCIPPLNLNSTSCRTGEMKMNKAEFLWRVSLTTCGCSELFLLSFSFSQPSCVCRPPPPQVQCEPCGRVSVCCDWLARWLPSGYTCPRRTPLAWGRCVVQSWRRGMRTCRIFWALTREGQNWHVPPHAPRSVAWRILWLSHPWWVWVFSSTVFSIIFLFFFSFMLQFCKKIPFAH